MYLCIINHTPSLREPTNRLYLWMSRFFSDTKKMVEDNRLGFLPEAISGLVESGGVVLGEVVTGFISLAVMAFRFKLA